MSSSAPQNLFRLKTSIQQYDWGKQGSSSLVAKLAPNAVGPEFKVDENSTYAEAWMGTHPNGPSSVYSTSQSLYDLVSSDPAHYLGTTHTQKWPNTTHIPYLFKILCAGKALPLQAHPDKKLGEELFRKDGGKGEFVDGNHKPEIAVAIGDELGEAWGEGTAFLGFVGFRPLGEIRGFLEGVSELREAVGDEGIVSAFVKSPEKKTLRAVYSRLLERGKSDPKAVGECVKKLVRRITGNEGELGLKLGETGKLVVKVNEQYPGDVGVLATAFFMNLMKLKRGEAVYCGADEVHAWLEGEIIECMATSDNVINTAFVPPEERDVNTFVHMLTYTSRPPADWFLPRTPYKQSKNGKTVKFDPPLEEFTVLWTSLPEQGLEEVLSASGGPTIGIVTKAGVVRFEVTGKSLEVGVGGVVFVAPGNDVSIRAVEGEGEVWWSTCL